VSNAESDIAQLHRLTEWTKHDSGTNRVPGETCGIGANTSYARTRMDHEVLTADDAIANREITDLDRRVVSYLLEHGWSVKPMGRHSGIPDTKRCYQKDGFVVQVFKTTGRCTMNSTCTAYDGLSVITYTPPGSGGSGR